MAEATPRPWTLRNLPHSVATDITGADGSDVAQIRYEPNAVLIVQAVNSFEELVATLLALYECFPEPTNASARTVLMNTKAVLQKAKPS